MGVLDAKEHAMAKRPVLLIIEDGWGIREVAHGNAIVQGDTPHFDHWMATRERAIVHTSGEHVGLTPDQMGNSEVGHLNLGAGRIVYQDITRIELAIREGTLAQEPALVGALDAARGAGGRVHLIGLLGTGGVHSHQDHLGALLDATSVAGLPAIVHVITDGRDTPTESGIGFLEALNEKLAAMPQPAQIATVSGRYYAMDRDKRWERTHKAFDAMVYRKGESAATAADAIRQSYAAGVTDEFILPTVIGENDDLAVRPGDTLIFYNFRADRMRQIVKGFAIRGHEGFTEGDFIADLHLLTFTEYEEGLPVHVLFGVQHLTNTLAQWLSLHGRTQYHTAETEKYPHVTFFFNGRVEEPYAGEERRIVPSPKVATYDLQPEMSAYELTEATLERIAGHDDDFILVNFANPDMVGHTGVLEAAIRATTVVDECAGRLVEAVVAKGGAAIVTADHGNCERMIDEVTGEAHTYHTVGPVSLFIIDGDTYYDLYTWGRLADVAPTVLDLLGMLQPPEMTGRSLIRARRALGE
jgi:2,3-bisphosphoglycerate-independent phosphoglycerate mutase